MVELFGIPLGTAFQGGTFAAVIALLAIVARVWIIGIPERLRAANEGKVAAAAELADRFKAWRAEVHDLKNETMKVAAKQAVCDKALSAAHTLNDQLVFLIELMISEMEAHDPKSKIVKRARTMFKRLADISADPDKSDALNTAELAVHDAKQTVISAKDTCEEVKRSEDK